MGFSLGQPNLTEEERTRSAGIVAIHYEDGHFRLHFFNESSFWEMPWPAAECCDGAIGDDCCGATFGSQWHEGEPVEITVGHVRDWYLPLLRKSWEATRATEQDVAWVAIEVYWKGERVHVEELHD